MSMKTAALALLLLWPTTVLATEPVPSRGQTMAQVKTRFGPPHQVDPPVGQPPITRWRYTDYTVYFERDICLHTVMDHPRPTNPPKTATHNAVSVTVAHNDDESAAPARRPSAFDGPGEERKHQSVSDHLRFNPASGRVEIVNDAKSGPSGSAIK